LVCSTKIGGELVKELESSGISFQCLGLKKNYNPMSFVKVMRYLKNNKVDVVITHGNYRLISRTSAILTQVPAVLHVEHNVSDYKKIYHVLANRSLTIFTDKIICISENARRSLLQIEKPRPDKVVVIPNGLNTERFKNPRNNTKVKNDTKRVGIVGRFADQKGHIYFVDAAARIVRAYKKVEFIFVGDGPLRMMIEKKVKEMGIDKYCHFLGVRSDVDALLQSFDVFVLSSLWEGLPISLLEAQYFGIASVVTAVGGNCEVIRNEYNGLLVEPKDSHALAAAILRLLNDDKLRNELGLRGKEVFEEKFTIERMAESYMGLIHTIVG
jgi:glycosyltransferase involved in cell wall biosynthesis